ncbi:MAG: amidase family protein [Polaribacter sp.]|jgi:amidase|nr:amidase family protein [Polaribacter sp.]MDG1954659.1 amidase family protein [Polaribacter sp.]
MKKIIFLFVFALLIISCKEEAPAVEFKKYDESAELVEQQKHPRKRMQLKLIQSKFLDMNDVFAPFKEELSGFSEDDYNDLKPMILERDIPTLQAHIGNGDLTYEKLTLFYLYRIRKFESDSTKSLNSIIALNPNVLEEARQKDKEQNRGSVYSIFGMPILLKDNINTKDMPTTAGAIALAENKNTNDAFIVERLRANGALILGKANLSEWAYFFCSGCPVGYSAVGGQTLNPYGRKVFETGGSSAGSGVTVAANFAVAAVGTETSGSITSPSSQNSVVGLKPTIGVLSRTGIVPISSTLDTPGPMTKNVIDNAIFLEAMFGFDTKDDASVDMDFGKKDFQNQLFEDNSLKGKRFGVLKDLLSNSNYKKTVQKMKDAGAEMIEIAPERARFSGFTTLLNIDMKHDFPNYLANNADQNVMIKSVKDVTLFNLKDSVLRAPYGQQLFDGIVKDETTLEELEVIKDGLQTVGQNFLQALFDKDLDAILSINNYHSGVSAVAEYPNLTIPMGYKENGEPISLTFIGKPYSEHKLLQVGYAFEQITKARKTPENYK